MIALEHPPAEVGAAGRHVDLLPGGLADVADEELARHPIEGKAKRVAQPEGVDLLTARRPSREGIVGRDPVRERARSVDVDPEDLSEQVVDVLRSIAGVVAGAAVAHADVEEPVGAELHHAAVVVREGLRDDEEDTLAARRRRQDRSSGRTPPPQSRRQACECS